ncbi:hypothetical protein B0H63DRAFT_494901 [Podospora didyma]|uniref:NAD(P)-binding protein n=1 Tax=Podospora didyma TaxID=330526 RepID=A0AAE0NGA7_9PEZI|nr:hypothetical protein B0H63DRAFT_494901 [Podospora didyma]
MDANDAPFPPKPSFTERELPDQSGKVYVAIVTGAATGMGLELAKILYSRNCTVYIATRSEAKISAAIASIQAAHPNSRGRLEPLIVDFSNLTTIKPAAASFLARESPLESAGSKGAQGHDLEMVTNVLGPYLLTRCLEERLVSTAREVGLAGKAATGVRIVWVTSFIGFGGAPGGVVWDDTTSSPTQLKAMENYMQSKTGDVFLAHEFAQRMGGEGVISVVRAPIQSVNPGLTKTELQRYMPAPCALPCHKYGAYSELFGALSPDVTKEKNGAYIMPWGRFGHVPADLAVAMAPASDGGNGLSRKFLHLCERETSAYA